MAQTGMRKKIAQLDGSLQKSAFLISAQMTFQYKE
jgi:hypothetical protein